tara:strand:- start:2044 stop:2991 length:948 start_codon:yes stop_codon:yes gene_type:complete
MKTEDIINGIFSSSFKAVSSAITDIEHKTPLSNQILSEIYNKTGNAYRIGITGPPGAGKSTLTNSLIHNIRQNNKTVAVLCIDPSSPFSGGSVLGDRIRMLEHYKDKGVFIRSMASRNVSGGLAVAASESADVLDAAGFDYVIFETLGVGQVEVDVVHEADSTVVVLVPESGDGIQMMKSGLMEVADIFVINKSDRDGADKLYESIKSMLEGTEIGGWFPSIIKTIAVKSKNIDKLFSKILDHKSFLDDNELLKIKSNLRYENHVKSIISNNFINQFWSHQKCENMLCEEIKKSNDKRLSPNDFADQLEKVFRDK